MKTRRGWQRSPGRSRHRRGNLSDRDNLDHHRMHRGPCTNHRRRPLTLIVIESSDVRTRLF